MAAIFSKNPLVLLKTSAKKRISKLPPVFQALLVQLMAFVLCLIFFPMLSHQLGFSMTAISGAFILGLIALVFSHMFKLAPWWHYINFFFVPALTGSLLLQISPLFFLVAFVLMATVYWSTFRTQVPLYLSSRQARQEVANLLPAQSGFRFVDLGSGVGGLLSYLHQVRPDGIYHGIESAPLPCFISWLRFRFTGNLKALWADFWRHNLKDYDVVYAYLSPVPMAALWEKAQLEMRPGTLFVSNSFNVPDVTPNHLIALDDFNKSTLYIWRM